MKIENMKYKNYERNSREIHLFLVKSKMQKIPLLSRLSAKVNKIKCFLYCMKNKLHVVIIIDICICIYGINM